MPKHLRPEPVARPVELTEFAAAQIQEVVGESAKRQIEALNLYRPMQWQEEYHACPAKRRIILGGVRSGKTLASMVETARAVMGRDPHDKYPVKDGTCIIVGANWTHFRMTVIPMLFKAGAFRIIRDLETRDWRAFDPEKDADRITETKPAPPLIPPRFIKPKGMKWVNKGQGALACCELITGWTIHCFSSDGEVAQGFNAHRVHIDEDVNQEEWIDEMQARTADAKGENRAGKLIDGGILDWSARPHTKNEALIGMAERAEAEEQAKLEERRVVRFAPTFLDNQHVSKKEREQTLRDMQMRGDDVVRMFIYGDPSMDEIRMYPNFNLAVHGVYPEQLYQLCRKPTDPPEGFLGEPPLDWCRYAAIDPGHTVCAVVFAAVPPPDVGDFVLIYDELYIGQCNAEIFGREMKRKTQGQCLQAFIIDAHGGRLTDFGSGIRPRDAYRDALKRHEVKSVLTGHDFLDGSDDVLARADALRVWMYSINGDSTLRVLRGRAPNLCEEIKRFKKKKARVDGRTVILEQPETRRACHAVQCLEMIAAYDPKYYRPPKKRKHNFARERLLAKRKKKNQNHKTLILAAGG